jgi:branched-chain amino acid transport system substrate-binding protein
MEDLMVELRPGPGKRWTSWIALLGISTLVLAACAPGGSASASASAASASASASQVALQPIPMKIGSMIPQTGALSGIVGSLENALKMAESEINAAHDGLVTIDFADDGTDDTVSSTNVEQFLTGDYNAITGPAASGNALAIWDAVNTANMVMCSGTNTGALFSADKYDPNYIRTSPSDDIQGPLLGNLILQDGHTDVAVIWQSTAYGEGFGKAVAKGITDAGGNVVLQQGYDPTLNSFADLAQAVVASGAEAVAMITYAEGAQLRLDLESAGFKGQIYVADGFVDNVTVKSVGGKKALLAGIRGTYPSSSPSTGEPTFPDRFAAFAPPNTPTIFSAHLYDCVAVLTLAAQVAQSSDPTVYVNDIVGVTRDGEKCTLIADCLAKVWAGTDIDYDGASGPLDFSPHGEPAIGTYNVIQYDKSGVSQNQEEIQGELPS